MAGHGNTNKLSRWKKGEDVWGNNNNNNKDPFTSKGKEKRKLH